MFSSTAGLFPSLLIGCAALKAALSPLIRSDRMSGFHAIGAGAAAFTASFSVLNLIVQPSAINQEWLESELASGLLVLRVISISAAIAFARLAAEGIKEEGFAIVGDFYEADYRVLDAEVKRRREWPLEKIAGQATVLLIVLCLLWALPLMSRASLLIALLNWAFAFTADDFFMAANYRVERNVAPPPYDAVVIWVWRTLITVLFALVMFQQFIWWVACLTLAVIGFFLIWAVLIHASHMLLLALDGMGVTPPEWDTDSVTMKGSVIRLSRESNDGPGKVVIRGRPDEGKTLNSYHVELVKQDYEAALHAHHEGLEVTAIGGLEIRGTYWSLQPVYFFSVISGTDD